MEDSFDVLVVGGGFGGVCAAAAAARTGAKTLLLERYGFLGGMATAGLVNPFMTYFAGGKQIIEGIFSEVLEGLGQRSGLGERGRIFDEELLKLVLDELVLSSGAEIRFHSYLSGVEKKKRLIKSAEFQGKSGAEKFEAQIFVDATGDGDLAALVGCPYEKGRKEDGLAQAMTLCFRVAGVDMDKVPGEAWKEKREFISRKFVEAKKRGEITNPRHNVLFFRTLRKDVIHFNTTRIVRRDATSASDLTCAEIEGRRQVEEMVRFLKKEIPGFENSFLEKMAMQIGVRESRRIMGEYVMTEEDIVEARKFKDAIARGSYPIDIHSPTGEGTVIKRLPPGESYDIPYRSLVPKEVDNLLIASRCISATHEAHGAIRVMPIVAAIGQAAGTAAALSIQEKTIPRKLDATKLRKKLVQDGANLGE